MILRISQDLTSRKTIELKSVFCMSLTTLRQPAGHHNVFFCIIGLRNVQECGCDFYTSWPKCGDICINPYKCWCGNKRMKNRSDISTSSEYCCSDQSCTYKQDKNYEVGTVRYAQFFLQNIKNSGT